MMPALLAALALATNAPTQHLTNAVLWGFDGSIPRGSFTITNEPRGGSDTPAFRTYVDISTNDFDIVVRVNGMQLASLIFNNGANNGRQGLPSEWVWYAQTEYLASERFLFGLPSDDYGGGPRGLCASLVLRNQAPGRDGYSVPIRFETVNKDGRTHYPGFFGQSVGTNGCRLVLGDIPYSTQRSPWCAAISNAVPWVYFTPDGIEVKGLIINGWRITVSNTGLVNAERVSTKPASKIPLTSPKQTAL